MTAQIIDLSGPLSRRRSTPRVDLWVKISHDLVSGAYAIALHDGQSGNSETLAAVDLHLQAANRARVAARSFNSRIVDHTILGQGPACNRERLANHKPRPAGVSLYLTRRLRWGVAIEPACRSWSAGYVYDQEVLAVAEARALSNLLGLPLTDHTGMAVVA